MSPSIELTVDRHTGDVTLCSPVLAFDHPWRHAQSFISRVLAADGVETVLIDRRTQTATIRLRKSPGPTQGSVSATASPSSNPAESLRQLANALRESSSSDVNVSDEYASIDRLVLQKTDEGLAGGMIVHSLPGRIRIRHPLIKKTDIARVQNSLAAVPGVHSVSVSPVTGSVLILFDRAVAAGQQLLGKLEGALTLDSRRINLLNGPPASRWVASGICLGLAAVSTASVPALAPVTAAALVGFNLPTMIQGVTELVTLKWRVASLYTVIMGTTLISGQFLAAALMQASITCWHGWSSRRLRRIASRLEQQAQVPLFISRSQPQFLEEGDKFPDTLIGSDVLVSPETVLPFDGEIVSGEGELDEHSVRGTTHIVRRRVGDAVFAGSILRSGSLRVRITAIENGTRVARIRETLLASIAELPGAGTPTKRGQLHASRFVPFTFATGTAAFMVGDLSTLAAVLRPDFATGPSISERFGALSSVGHLWDQGWLVQNPDVLHELARTEAVIVCRSMAIQDGNTSGDALQVKMRSISLGGRQLSVYDVVGQEEQCVDFARQLRGEKTVALVADSTLLKRFEAGELIRISMTPEQALMDHSADLISLRGEATQIEDLWHVLMDAQRPHHHGWAAVMACNILAISGAFLVGLTSLHVVLITNLGALAVGALYDRHVKRSSQILSAAPLKSAAVKPGSQVIFVDSHRDGTRRKVLDPDLQPADAVKPAKPRDPAKFKSRRAKTADARRGQRDKQVHRSHDPVKPTSTEQS